VETKKDEKKKDGYDGPFATQINRINRNDATLKILNLSGKNVEDKTAIEIFKALESNTNLTKLDLTENNLTEETLESFTKMLSSNKIIETIELEGNKFKSSFVDDFISAIEKNTTLVDITVSEYASDEQLDKIDDILDRNYDIKKKERKGNERTKRS